MSSYISNFNIDIRGLEGAPKLVFLHGLMGSWVNWRRIITAFEDRYQILSYDQRGHGKSFRPSLKGSTSVQNGTITTHSNIGTGYSPADYANDLFLILNELGWDRVNLVGHSMGGRNAIVFAAQHPDRVEKLVIEDIGLDGSEENISKMENILGRVPTPFHDKRMAKETILAAFEDQVLAQYLYSNITEVSAGVYDWRFSREAILASVREGRSRDFWPEWKAIRSEGLLIRGDRSDELDQGTYERMLSANSNFRGVVVESAAHWVHFDQPDKFIQELRKFF